jgi:hypothetical protein
LEDVLKRVFQFLIIIIIVLTSCSKDESITQSNQDYNERASGSLSLSFVKAIVIENQTGGVVIEGNSDTTKIGWFLDKHVIAESYAAANEVFSNIRVTLKTTNDTAYVTVEIPPAANSNNTQLSLTAPNNIPCILRMVDGESNISYLQNNFVGENVASINIVGHTGNCVLNGTGENAAVEMAIPDNGLCRINLDAGNITLKIPSATSSMLSAFSSDGAVFSSGIVIDDLSQSSNSLSGKLGTGNGVIELSTGKGNISIVGF